jgi:hypothetical protein
MQVSRFLRKHTIPVARRGSLLVDVALPVFQPKSQAAFMRGDHAATRSQSCIYTTVR